MMMYVAQRSEVRTVDDLNTITGADAELCKDCDISNREQLSNVSRCSGLD